MLFQNEEHMNADTLRERNHEHPFKSFLTATQASMVKRSIARPSKVLFVLLRKTKTHRPRTRTKATVANSRPNEFLRSAKHHCPRVPLTGMAWHFQNALSGEIIKVQIPPPRHWVAPGPGTCDRFINFICPQVMAPSTSTAPAS